MAEFERAKHNVGNRSVIITSWFDTASQTWRASAPEYAYLRLITEGTQTQSATRLLAIQRLTQALTGHLAAEQARNP